jgi:hypothetical protein
VDTGTHGVGTVAFGAAKGVELAQRNFFGDGQKSTRLVRPREKTAAASKPAQARGGQKGQG